MSGLAVLFLNNLAPTFLVAGAGYLLGKRFKMTPQSLSQVVFYFFSPCLVFNLLLNSQLSGQDVLRIFAFAALVTSIMGVVAWASGRLLGIQRKTLAAVMITVMFMNAGNLGLPVEKFAFGDAALAHASLFFVAMSMMTNTVGVVIVSVGSLDIRKALLGVLKIPAVYGLVLGLLMSALHWRLPLFLERTVKLAADAAIPTMMVLLGLQLQRARWTGQIKPLVLVTFLRLAVAPAVAFAISLLFGLQGASRQAGILESAMPTAVLCTVLATEFGVEPEFVTMTVFFTTILSPLTLTPLILWLGG